jgi:hypothetical protein
MRSCINCKRFYYCRGHESRGCCSGHMYHNEDISPLWDLSKCPPYSIKPNKKLLLV